MSTEPTWDLVIAGSGLFAAVLAHEATQRGKRVLVVERRDHLGGNCYTKRLDGIDVQMYGAHIFRTDDRDTWDYVGQFCTFNNFINSPVANFHGKLYNMPFNMNTFYQLWGTTTPEQARAKIESQRVVCEHPANLEEHVLDMVGTDIYETLIKGYTEKQWGKPASELPASIMRRIPLRFTFDNNYFNARYQGIPEQGYTHLLEALLEGAEVRCGVDYLANRDELSHSAALTVFTGPIDEYYDYRFGPLEYRALRFEHEQLDEQNHQGVAVVNYTDAETPYTRTIEHKHFVFGTQPTTVVSREYPAEWKPGMEPYYPVESAQNQERYQQYLELAHAEGALRFGGRLGEYRYYDMQDTIRSARAKAAEWLS